MILSIILACGKILCSNWSAALVCIPQLASRARVAGEGQLTCGAAECRIRCGDKAGSIFFLIFLFSFLGNF